MSFNVTLKKNETGSYDIAVSSQPEYCPDQIDIMGHVDENGQAVDLQVRVPGLMATGSRR